ncbi:transmembrane protein 107 [Haliaeetus albicilla]|uniref:transmembrane protein 107 n=1 Tax=Haliaeetus albicilla TaxID=8969 RepID=UPI0037E7DC53
MPPRGSLVPARFLVLTAHLVLLLQLGWGRDPHVRASLPLEFSAEEYAHADRLLGGALGGALGLLGVEFVGFFSGVSMFHPGQSLLSLAAHGGAALALAWALLEGWDSSCFWLLFGLCSVPPAITEVLLMVSMLGCRRRAI